MRFKVGPWTYRVEIAALKEDHAGWCDWVEQRIILSATVPTSRRLPVLLHELRHAWQYHFGRPDDNEGDSNSAAAFAADAMRQLQAQGGERALMSLGTDTRKAPHGNRGAECVGCGGKFAPWNIQSDPPVMLPSGEMACKRWLECDFCGHVQKWVEEVTQDGRPNGNIIEGPTLTSMAVDGISSLLPVASASDCPPPPPKE